MFQNYLNEIENIVPQLSYNLNGFTFRNAEYRSDGKNTIRNLISVLYSECYAKKICFQNNPKADNPWGREWVGSFVDQLSVSNKSKESTAVGWQIKEIFPNGYLKVSKSGLTSTLPLHRIEDYNIRNITVGSIVSVRMPREDRQIQPGFYYAYGNHPVDYDESLIRIYWNTIPDGALCLVNAITTLLNHYHIPFLFKCLDYPSGYVRRDGCVLYIYKRHYTVCSWLIEAIYAEMQPYLEDDIPLFTFRFKPGIGIAENPSYHESFGMNRMNLLASALTEFFKEFSKSDFIGFLTKKFQHQGLDLHFPFLNKGTKLNFLH